MLKVDDENFFISFLGIDEDDLMDNYINFYLYF